MPDGAHTVSVDYGEPPGEGTYDDRDPLISYGSGWLTVNASGPYDGTLTYSNTINTSGSFTFMGDGITIVYTGSTNRGVLEVSIDGGTPVSINQYRSSTMFQQQWSSGALGAGVHTITFTHKSGTYVDVDAFIVVATVTTSSPDSIFGTNLLSTQPFWMDTVGVVDLPDQLAFNPIIMRNSAFTNFPLLFCQGNIWNDSRNFF